VDILLQEHVPDGCHSFDLPDQSMLVEDEGVAVAGSQSEGFAIGNLSKRLGLILILEDVDDLMPRDTGCFLYELTGDANHVTAFRVGWSKATARHL